MSYLSLWPVPDLLIIGVSTGVGVKKIIIENFQIVIEKQI